MCADAGPKGEFVNIGVLLHELGTGAEARHAGSIHSRLGTRTLHPRGCDTVNCWKNLEGELSSGGLSQGCESAQDPKDAFEG